MRVLDGVDIWQEDVVHLLLCKIHHVTVHQFHRIAGFPLCILLGKLHRLFVAGMGQHYVVAKVFEKLIGKGEELEHYQYQRYTDGLLLRVNGGIIATDRELPRHLIQSLVLTDLFGHFLHVPLGSRKIKSKEGAFF